MVVAHESSNSPFAAMRRRLAEKGVPLDFVDAFDLEYCFPKHGEATRQTAKRLLVPSARGPHSAAFVGWLADFLLGDTPTIAYEADVAHEVAAEWYGTVAQPDRVVEITCEDVIFCYQSGN